MAKQKSIFNCTQCGTQHSKWMGQCQGCKEWNTLVEEVEIKSKPDPRAWSGEQAARSKIPHGKAFVSPQSNTLLFEPSNTANKSTA